MNKQSGFAIVEGLIIIVVVAALAGGGLTVWQHHQKSVNPATNARLNYDSPAVTTPSAPSVAGPTGLDSALQTLNQTNVDASTTDSTQLSNQAAGF
jgi:hypothetical protein